MGHDAFYLLDVVPGMDERIASLTYSRMYHLHSATFHSYLISSCTIQSLPSGSCVLYALVCAPHRAEVCCRSFAVRITPATHGSLSLGTSRYAHAMPMLCSCYAHAMLMLSLMAMLMTTRMRMRMGWRLRIRSNPLSLGGDR